MASARIDRAKYRSTSPLGLVGSWCGPRPGNFCSQSAGDCYFMIPVNAKSCLLERTLLTQVEPPSASCWRRRRLRISPRESGLTKGLRIKPQDVSQPLSGQKAAQVPCLLLGQRRCVRPHLTPELCWDHCGAVTVSDYLVARPH